MASLADGGPPIAPAVEPERFSLKAWNAVGLWSWDVLVDNCAICRNHLMEPSIEYQSMNPDHATPDHAGLQIAFGCCGHVFHLDCIQRWLKTRNVCPLCNRDWEFSKIESIGRGCFDRTGVAFRAQS
mmetsp:Transcript_28631/g.72527  ORF Transcript_28631/g.72527 Transcript_28631/m.72527 type:complete len:127 (+) Transcript_28631:153-533(+)|eukprot:g3084.t1